MKPPELRRLVAGAEGACLEFKRTTGELREGLQTICAFLNSSGGRLVFGVDDEGRVQGQQVSRQTLHEISAALQRFEPPARVEVERIPAGAGREAIVLCVEADTESVPYAFEGRPYERVENTTRRMSQQRYETLLLKRAYGRRRWENQPAEGLCIKDLDGEEILQTRASAITHRRISAGTSADVVDVLDRLGLRVGGMLTQAAQALYGTRFLPDYPQCLLKMGHFKGTTITGDILDNKQEYMHAFAMVKEGMAFLDRALPLAARFPKMKRYDARQIIREDRLPIPAEAIREVLLNAVMHRDYSDYGGHVAIAVFDDRVEIRSTGRLPAGLTVEDLSREHRSQLRNPLVASAFHRTGAVEIWGRGTNRVIEACLAHGTRPPVFSDMGGMLVVSFPMQSAGTAFGKGTLEAITARQRVILDLIRSKGQVGNREARTALGVSDETARKELAAMLKARIVVLMGKGRAARYGLP